MNLKTIYLFFVIGLFLAPSAFTQDLNQLVSKYTEENGSGYLQPLADATGSVFNSGYYHGAPLKKMGVQVYLGVVTTFAMVPEKNKTFMATTEGSFTPQQTAEVPTVFGPAESLHVSGDGGTEYVFPAGFNVTMVPFAIPQLSIGSIYGTQATFRFFTFSINEDIGKVNMFSWGISHSISQYIESLPLELSAGFYNSYFSFGKYITASSWIMNMQASKRILIFTFYGGLGYERAKLNIDYSDKDEETTIVYDLTGRNSIRFMAGLTFNLGPVKLNVDYSLARQGTLSAGIGVGIGEKE